MFSLKSTLAVALLAVAAVWADESPDGTCGGEAAYTCPGDTKCCSTHGFCGATDEYCLTTAGCQAEFSNSADSCTEPVDKVSISPDGTCGSEGAGEYGYRCPAEGETTCCSAAGYCGNTPDHCTADAGCQADYGTCA
ncbi:carbohydrate-binding module family 18 protein [Hypoxylon sp. FL1284]|nr:carbohydrate-binding module family 18 protein [Hypoxylon sp. FL1284]